MGPYREAAVALTFENEGVVYDPEDELVRFVAAEGVLLVRCGISKAALAALEDDALTDPDAIVTAYLRNGELIQDIVAVIPPIGSRPVGSWWFAFRICPRKLRD